MHQSAVMPEAESPLLLNLLYTALGLLVLTLLVSWSISRRLSRLERHLAQTQSQPQSDSTPPSAAETSAGGAFEAFLSEDPARKNLPKGEQFASYRKWRQSKGLNWSGS
jgi:hypothetical protein